MTAWAGLFLALLPATTLADGNAAVGTPVKLSVQRLLTTQPVHGTILGVVTSRPVTVEKSAVYYEVAEDVKNERGEVVIARGAVAVGRVVESQVAGGVHAKARLVIRVDYVYGEDGRRIPLRFGDWNRGKWIKNFSRGETGQYAEAQKPPKRFTLPNYSAVASDFEDLILRGEYRELVKDPKRVAGLQYFAQQSGLADVVRFIQDGRIADLAQLATWVTGGGFTIRTLADVKHLERAYHLLKDSIQVAARMSHWIGSKMDGAQITVLPGFPVEAVVDDRPLDGDTPTDEVQAG